MQKQKVFGISLLFLLGIVVVFVSSGNADRYLPFNVSPEETGEHQGDHNYPNFEGSIVIDEDYSGDLTELTTVDKAQAEKAALAYTTGGEVISSNLENENGYLVWKIIISFEGQNYEITVDAGNASILWASTDDGESQE